MADTGPSGAIVYQFEQDFEHLFQQHLERLKQYVRVKTGVTGSMTAFGRLGESEMTDITGDRGGDTHWHDSPSSRRWAVKQDFEDAQLLTAEDRLEVLVDLEMGYAENSAFAAARQMDKLVIDAVTATAVSGATGTATSTYLTTAPVSDGSGGNQIALGSSPNDGLVLDKMRDARMYFDAREVGTDDMTVGQSEFVWVTNAKGHRDLLGQTEVISSDYIGVEIVRGEERSSRMPLVQGRIPFMMGFRIIISNQLNLSGGNPVNLAWHRRAMGLAVWGPAPGDFSVDRLPTKHNAMGIITKKHMGAVRVQDRGVLSIVCLA